MNIVIGSKGTKLVRVLHGAGTKSASLGYTIKQVKKDRIVVEGNDSTFEVNPATGRDLAEGFAGFWNEFIPLES